MKRLLDLRTETHMMTELVQLVESLTAVQYSRVYSQQ